MYDGQPYYIAYNYHDILIQTHTKNPLEQSKSIHAIKCRYKIDIWNSPSNNKKKDFQILFLVFAQMVYVLLLLLNLCDGSNNKGREML